MSGWRVCSCYSSSICLEIVGFISALLVSMALLLHVQGEAFIPLLAFYRPPPVPAGLRDDGGAHSKDKGGGIPGGGSSRA